MAGLLLLALDVAALAVVLLTAPASPFSLHGHFSAGGSVRTQHHQQQADAADHGGEHHVPADGALAHEFLEAHNRLRAKYGVPPLRWSSKLARYARRWSSMRRFDCVMMHSPASPYGENVFWGSGSDWRAADAVAKWATEASYFDWRAQACHPGQVCGHFTQLVWNDTEYVGCGRSECLTGGVFITCSYDPPGNWKGEVPLT
ncbi:hypothetical protein GQ55_3G143600 [Panicum hallii var. hallii]|uniref:SCP domain-containing protein n=1 Tax=Panicum hallii var. hallii TaxID=1504633 RepID=A0A2T7E9C2_9POAL|nr:hypothetical protein GQ55_3G143600 [Panicum hallii var. hallii]